MSKTETEFVCEVVRVIELKPHPGADRLEIAHIALTTGPAGYTCVVRKGDFKEGDLGEYFGLDCLIPMVNCHEQFTFLKAQTSKSAFRVRAIRLRGIYSEGLLLPCRLTSTLGDDLSVDYGITQYVHPSLRPDKLPTQPSVKRAKAVYLGPDYAVTSLKKAPFTFEPNELVHVTEKIHGSNFRAGWVSNGWRHRFVVGSHHTIKTFIPTAWERIKTWFGWTPKKKGFYATDVWSQAATRYKLEEKLKPFPGYVFYAELYGAGIQDLTYGDNQNPELVFYDVYDTLQARWLEDWEAAGLIAQAHLPTPAGLYFGPYDHSTMLALAEGKSTMASHVREGIVVSSAKGPRKKGKIVGQGYLLRGDNS